MCISEINLLFLLPILNTHTIIDCNREKKLTEKDNLGFPFIVDHALTQHILYSILYAKACNHPGRQTNLHSWHQVYGSENIFRNLIISIQCKISWPMPFLAQWCCKRCMLHANLILVNLLRDSLLTKRETNSTHII